MEWLIELKDNIDRHGIRWGIFFTLIAVYRKERRNRRLDKRDAALFHNQKVIMEQLGVGDKWVVANVNWSADMEQKLLHSSQKALSHARTTTLSIQRKATNQFKLSRRRIHMKKINWLTLIPCLMGALKILLQARGIQIPDDTINTLVNALGGSLTLLGVYLPHTKTVTQSIVQELPDLAQTFKHIQADPNIDYKTLQPIMMDVHNKINLCYQAATSGKGGAAVVEAASVYQTVQSYLNSIDLPELAKKGA